MKFDMHCHTKECSIDAKVDLEHYIKKLIKDGFDGMLITDHNSYKGYEKWNEIKRKIQTSKPFTVLKGIEYDTLDAGHFIAILPDEVSCKLLDLRGLTVKELEKLVHHLGGILGPAHPYGTGYFAFMHTKPSKRNKSIMERFDFIETFNSCAHPKANEKAFALAEKLQLPHFAGSDAHRKDAIGTAFTEFGERIRNNNDLINLVKKAKKCPQFQNCPDKKSCHKDFKEIHTSVLTKVDSNLMTNVYRNTNIIIRELGIIGYYLYNKSAAALRFPRRRLEKRHYHNLIKK